MKKRLVLLSGLVFFSLPPQSAYAQEAETGTEIKVRLVGGLDTGELRPGQTFSAVLQEPVRIDKKTVLAKGATVKGKVTEVENPGPLKRTAIITLQLTGLGTKKVATEPLQIDGRGHAVRDTSPSSAGTATLASSCGIAGGSKLELIGKSYRVGAGPGSAFLTGEHELVLPSETQLTFVLASAATPAKTAAPAEPRMETMSGLSTSYFGPGPLGGAGVLIAPPPPSPQVIYVEAAPGPEFIWVQGYWYPVDSFYVWHEGYWTRPPYERAHWIAPHYDGERYFAGYWSGVGGRVEHDHRWDHDRERDFRDVGLDRQRELHAKRHAD